jgi:thioredoxin 1
MDSKVIYISDQDFDTVVLGAENPVLVDFWADWCAPCHMVAPLLEQIAGERDGKIVIAKLNIDENPEVTQRYGIMSIPTLVVFYDGAPVEGTVGAVPYEPLNDWVGSLLERIASDTILD